jgi:hypothetical protein
VLVSSAHHYQGTKKKKASKQQAKLNLNLIYNNLKTE